MKIAGIIAEYNPFHNGHEYQINKTKEITGADKIIVCMSGNFLQRGEPAFIDKYLRTRLALLGGADLVIELPVKYSTASAENFALGGISVLEALGCVDYISFGCETPDLKLMDSIASVLADEPKAYQEVLNQQLRKGASYPEARQGAVKACLMETVNCLAISRDEIEQKLDSILSEPNNTLALEYMKALKRIGSKMQPVAIKREGAGYNEALIRFTGVVGKPGVQDIQSIASARGIRQLVLQGMWKESGDYNLLERELKAMLPKACLPDFMEQIRNHNFVTIDDYSQILKYKIKQEISRGESLQKYADVSEEIENRIIRNIDKLGKISDFIPEIKTKQYTYTRISRCLVHIMLDVMQEEYKNIGNNSALKISDYDSKPEHYCRILGFNKESSDLVKRITDGSRIPAITKPSTAKDILEGDAKKAFYQDVAASELYHIIFDDEYNEYRQNMVIV